ncbi:hypothetical protein [Streptomyces sp. NPDC097619]|uniref:hypothetical protein n=1 Tax=Streptomyces sp. NPDC097619 TaxID=3157228 RepID=UPI0033309EC2
MSGARRPRPRGRTTALILAAALLGTLAGTATGYAVQYDRAPTPLPPLAQQVLPDPKVRAAGPATTVRSLNANRWHRTDGDLTPLLVKPPRGARVTLSAGYQELDGYAADFFDYPASMVEKLLGAGFRRSSAVEWSENDRTVTTVRLIQFRDWEGAEHFEDDQAAYMSDEEHAGNLGGDVPGVGAENGRLWIYSEADREAGYLPTRQARAIARRGDLVMDIWVWDNRGTISERALRALAKKQLERL